MRIYTIKQKNNRIQTLAYYLGLIDELHEIMEKKEKGTKYNSSETEKIIRELRWMLINGMKYEIRLHIILINEQPLIILFILIIMVIDIESYYVDCQTSNILNILNIKCILLKMYY